MEEEEVEEEEVEEEEEEVEEEGGGTLSFSKIVVDTGAAARPSAACTAAVAVAAAVAPSLPLLLLLPLLPHTSIPSKLKSKRPFTGTLPKICRGTPSPSFPPSVPPSPVLDVAPIK